MSGRSRALLAILLGILPLSLALTCETAPEPPGSPATLSFESSVSPNPPSYAVRIDVFIETDDFVQAVDVEIDLSSSGSPQLWAFPASDFDDDDALFGGEPFITTQEGQAHAIDFRHGAGVAGRVQILTLWIYEAGGNAVSITATAESAAPDGTRFETSSAQVAFPQL